VVEERAERLGDTATAEGEGEGEGE